VHALLEGSEAFESFSAKMQSGWMIAVHVLLLGGLLFHSITWFNLAPKAMVIKVGERNIPGIIIALLNYAGWVVISVAIAWLMLR
jgi:fumarate reductase subunit C